MSREMLHRCGDAETRKQPLQPPPCDRSPDALSQNDRPIGVLLIEDHRAMLRAMEQGLRDRGFAVWSAMDGIAGVELYRSFREHIDIVLSDVQMPGLDGPAVLDALREIDPFVRCCFMTGDPRPSTPGSLLRRGALRVFAKPFSVAAVIDELRALATRPRDHFDKDSRREDVKACAGTAPLNSTEEPRMDAGGVRRFFATLTRSVGGIGSRWGGARTQPQPPALPSLRPPLP